ncbi:molybdopterin-dependent oxidoreductase [Aquisphaera insulae]|uniref:molybdopterin-dependent oxidoreductase n=1 Tax=Aquisphaera insulae TaxID=2712864 RepID=UPI0013ECD91C|nr:molybdopterin-dependent oxidoreductase [Aquisphaera insulae]
MRDPSRRDTFRIAAGLAAGTVAGAIPDLSAAAADARADEARRRYLTPGDEFGDVSRGDPVPHSLRGEALVKARLTPEAWRLEVVAEGKAKVPSPRRIDDGTAVDLATLAKLGEAKGVLFLKAMQCTNIAYPLGQGLWEGVPLREVLRLAGPMKEVRRVAYWGFHNDDPKQLFRSSLAINQVLDTPPGELPPLVAYRLNGGPIPLERGGPVRMIVPWAHGFKSIKWLRHVVLTNDYRANDTYALEDNDPESYLKTAAYIDDDEREATFATGTPAIIRGTAMVGWPGLDRVECWLRPIPEPAPARAAELKDDDPAWATATWKACRMDPPPSDLAAELPAGVDPARIWGFGRDGRPREWPMRYSLAPWSVTLEGLKPGTYELRARAVDRNGFAQPEPRPFAQRSGMNGIQARRIRIGDGPPRAGR